jgi:hypothetical protein
MKTMQMNKLIETNPSIIIKTQKKNAVGQFDITIKQESGEFYRINEVTPSMNELLSYATHGKDKFAPAIGDGILVRCSLFGSESKISELIFPLMSEDKADSLGYTEDVTTWINIKKEERIVASMQSTLKGKDLVWVHDDEKKNIKIVSNKRGDNCNE